MAKLSYRGDSRGKMTCHRLRLRTETSTTILMNGGNPNYNMTRPNFGLNLRNCCRNVRRETVYSASRCHLGFAVPTRGYTPSGEKLKLQHILFYLLIINLSLYSVLISFAQNLYYKMLWVRSSQLWRINMATAQCVETTGESHVHFAKHSHGKWKRPR